MRKEKVQDGPLTDNNPRGSDRLMQFIGNRFGQRPKTRDRYAEAVQACKSIEHLDKSVGEIARMFGHGDQCLRNQLKRHFPEVLELRNRLRVLLGMDTKLRGVSKETELKYAPAVEMLRTTDLTIAEVAQRCNVSSQGLQQHVLYHHRDLAQRRLEKRFHAVDQRATGGMSGTGRPNRPRKATEALYAEALEMYRTTDLTVPEIALKCGVITHNFQCYLQRWCRSDMAVREKLRQEKLEQQRKEREEIGNRSRTFKALKKYSPALKIIEDGATYEEAAERLGVDVGNLCWWVRNNHPEIHWQEHQNQIVWLPEGTSCRKSSWDRFGEAVHAYCETDESINEIARRFGLYPSSLRNFLVRKFPQAVAQRRKKNEDN